MATTTARLQHLSPPAAAAAVAQAAQAALSMPADSIVKAGGVAAAVGNDNDNDNNTAYVEIEEAAVAHDCDHHHHDDQQQNHHNHHPQTPRYEPSPISFSGATGPGPVAVPAGRALNVPPLKLVKLFPQKEQKSDSNGTFYHRLLPSSNSHNHSSNNHYHQNNHHHQQQQHHHKCCSSTSGTSEDAINTTAPPSESARISQCDDVSLKDMYTSSVAADSAAYKRQLMRAEANAIAKQKLIYASVICAFFMIVEIVAGIVANSLALVTDAAHMLSDLSSFLISLFALYISNFPGTLKLSFGYHRAEILGAMISVIIIWSLTMFLVYEAILRLQNPVPVNGSIMFATAFVGTLANIFMTYMLGMHSHGIGSAPCSGGSSSSSHNHHNHHDHDHDHHHDHHSNSDGAIHENHHFHNDYESDDHNIRNHNHYESDAGHHEHYNYDHGDSTIGIEANYTSINDSGEPLVDTTADMVSSNVNLRAAYIHAFGDLLQNIGVLIAAILIWLKPSWSIADPICTFIFSIMVLATTASIVKEATTVLMEGVPGELDLPGLKEALLGISNVSEMHDLHVWSLSVGRPSLACHIVVDSEANARRVLREATKVCQRKFGILHTTIQIDFSANKLACDTDAHSKCH